MKYALLGVLFMALSIPAGADATVLPASTVISLPGGFPTTLDSAHFLLTREDMEAAALALETLPIREAEIAKLNAQVQALQSRYTIAFDVACVAVPLSVILALLLVLR